LPVTRLAAANPLSLAVAPLVRVFGSSRSSLLHRDIFRAVQLRPWTVVLPCFFEHVVVRRWLVFVIVRFAIIFAHRMIDKLVPHQDASQIRMAIKANAVEVKNLSLLKFRTAPGGSERRQPRRALCTVCRAHTNHHRT